MVDAVWCMLYSSPKMVVVKEDEDISKFTIQNKFYAYILSGTPTLVV